MKIYPSNHSITLNYFGSDRHLLKDRDFTFEVNENFSGDLNMLTQALAEEAREDGTMILVDDMTSPYTINMMCITKEDIKSDSPL